MLRKVINLESLLLCNAFGENANALLIPVPLQVPSKWEELKKDRWDNKKESDRKGQHPITLKLSPRGEDATLQLLLQWRRPLVCGVSSLWQQFRTDHFLTTASWLVQAR